MLGAMPFSGTARVLRRGPPSLDLGGWCCGVPGNHCRVLWTGQVAVAMTPPEIDLSIADAVREELLAAVNAGATVLITDMSKTTFCDSSGVRALVRTFQRATASGTK